MPAREKAYLFICICGAMLTDSFQQDTAVFTIQDLSSGVLLVANGFAALEATPQPLTSSTILSAPVTRKYSYIRVHPWAILFSSATTVGPKMSSCLDLSPPNRIRWWFFSADNLAQPCHLPRT